MIPRRKITNIENRIHSLNEDIGDAEFLIESAKNSIKCMKQGILVLESSIKERENDILDSVTTIEASKEEIRELAIEIEEIKQRWGIE